MAAPLVHLHDQAIEAPLQWAPVLAMLIRNHARDLHPSDYMSWLQAASKHSLEDGHEPASVLWKLRYLHELALAWPAALTLPETDTDTNGVDLSQVEGCWKVQLLTY